MVHVELTMDDKGQCAGTTQATPVSVHHMFRDLWQRFVTEGLITQVRRNKLWSYHTYVQEHLLSDTLLNWRCGGLAVSVLDRARSL